jgi:hypothetical protein
MFYLNVFGQHTGKQKILNLVPTSLLLIFSQMQFQSLATVLKYLKFATLFKD